MPTKINKYNQNGKWNEALLAYANQQYLAACAYVNPTSRHDSVEKMCLIRCALDYALLVEEESVEKYRFMSLYYSETFLDENAEQKKIRIKHKEQCDNKYDELVSINQLAQSSDMIAEHTRKAMAKFHAVKMTVYRTFYHDEAKKGKYPCTPIIVEQLSSRLQDYWGNEFFEANKTTILNMLAHVSKELAGCSVKETLYKKYQYLHFLLRKRNSDDEDDEKNIKAVYSLLKAIWVVASKQKFMESSLWENMFCTNQFGNMIALCATQTCFYDFIVIDEENIPEQYGECNILNDIRLTLIRAIFTIKSPLFLHNLDLLFKQWLDENEYEHAKKVFDQQIINGDKLSHLRNMLQYFASNNKLRSTYNDFVFVLIQLALSLQKPPALKEFVYKTIYTDSQDPESAGLFFGDQLKKVYRLNTQPDESANMNNSQFYDGQRLVHDTTPLREQKPFVNDGNSLASTSTVTNQSNPNLYGAQLLENKSEFYTKYPIITGRLQFPQSTCSYQQSNRYLTSRWANPDDRNRISGTGNLHNLKRTHGQMHHRRDEHQSRLKISTATNAVNPYYRQPEARKMFRTNKQSQFFSRTPTEKPQNNGLGYDIKSGYTIQPRENSQSSFTLRNNQDRNNQDDALLPHQRYHYEQPASGYVPSEEIKDNRVVPHWRKLDHRRNKQ